MVNPCDKPCGNKTASGYCATTVCINPKYSNIGTVQYGQGVQKSSVTHGDELRSMTDEELAWELCRICRMPFYKDDSEIDEYEVDCWAKWLKEEAT